MNRVFAATPATPAVPNIPPAAPIRTALREWAEASYGPRGWDHVSLVVERPGGGPADVIQVSRKG